jgi:hypothetical protein
MQDHNSILLSPDRRPWNKGKLIGAKPPLLARHVWSIRTRLQIERRTPEQRDTLAQQPSGAQIGKGGCRDAILGEGIGNLQLMGYSG